MLFESIRCTVLKLTQNAQKVIGILYSEYYPNLIARRS